MTTRQEEIAERQKQAAKTILEKRFMALGERHIASIEAQQALFEERSEMEELWRLAGFGDPPPFRPSVQLVMAG